MKDVTMVIIRPAVPMGEIRWPMNPQGQLLSIGEAAAWLNSMRWTTSPDPGPPQIEVLEPPK